jgi:oligopeptide transport system substrate-binding protein
MNVHVDALQFSIIEDPQTALSLFEKKELDWVGEPFGNIPLDAIPALKREKNLQIKTIGGLYWCKLNVQHPMLQTSKIRRALAYAINRFDLTEHLLQGGETPAFSMVPPDISMLASQPFRDHDVQTAKALLHEGLKELNMTEQTMPLITLTHSSDPRDKAIASALQQQLTANLGLPIQLASCDFNTYLKKCMSGDFDMICMFWYTFYKDPTYNLESIKYKNSGFNGTGWENNRFIALLDQADQELNPARRNEHIKQAEMLVLEEMPIIPLYNHTYKYMKAPRIQNDYISPTGHLELKEVTISDRAL